MHLSRLILDNFRNYSSLSVEFPPSGALLFGANASGKTNLLEAIFFLCTARSQRQATRDEMIRFSSDYCRIEGVFSGLDGAAVKTVSSGFSRDKKVGIKVNGAAVRCFSEWFGQSLAISFGPDDIKLIQGMPKERRTFIDVLLSQIDPSYLNNLMLYKKNCVQRNALLARHIDDMHMDIYEEKMAQHGASVFLKRQELLAFIKPYFAQFYREISGGRENASIEYKPSIRCDLSTFEQWKNVFYKGLKSARKKDISNGFSSVGPHRDDVYISVNDKAAKPFASLGQCTTLTLALRMCSVVCGEVNKKDSMIFLFDDALTYLDESRTSRIFPLIKNKGQIFIATSSEREIALGELPQLTVQDGQVRYR